MNQNKIIAQFMGLRFENNQYYTPTYNSGEWLTESELQFHNSWDWLMPVVEKINSLTDELGNTNDFTIGSDYVWVDPHIGDRLFFSGYDREEPMISKVYRGVVRFVEETLKQ